MFTDVIKAICQAAVAAVPLVDSVSPQTITHSAGEEIRCGDTFNHVDWVAEQKKDQVISRVIQ